MSKRIRGEGSVSHRPDGRWQGQLCRDGTRETVYGRTQQEAADKLMALRARKGAGLPRIDQRTTVRSFLLGWLDRKPRLRPTTARRYRQIIEQQLVPGLGHLKLAKLSPADVANLLAKLQQDGLSPQSVGHVRAVLRAALADALRGQMVSRNVAGAALVEAPRVPDPDPVVLSVEQTDQVLDALSDPSLRRLALVAIRTGLRSGEELGMAWSDVDFSTRQIRVTHALQRMGGAYSLVEPKSRSSRRVIELDDPTLDALQEERGAQAAAQLAAGRRWKQSVPGLVWTTAHGEPRNATSLTHAFQDALAAAGLPRLRWHDLRAAHAGLLLAAKVDISVVSKMLGHSSVALTSRHYAGVSEALKRQASDSLAALLSRSS